MLTLAAISLVIAVAAVAYLVVEFAAAAVALLQFDTWRRTQDQLDAQRVDDLAFWARATRSPIMIERIVARQMLDAI
jgi:hypothetical protein